MRYQPFMLRVENSTLLESWGRKDDILTKKHNSLEELSMKKSVDAYKEILELHNAENYGFKSVKCARHYTFFRMRIYYRSNDKSLMGKSE